MAIKLYKCDHVHLINAKAPTCQCSVDVWLYPNLKHDSTRRNKYKFYLAWSRRGCSCSKCTAKGSRALGSWWGQIKGTVWKPRRSLSSSMALAIWNLGALWRRLANCLWLRIDWSMFSTLLLYILYQYGHVSWWAWMRNLHTSNRRSTIGIRKLLQGMVPFGLTSTGRLDA